MGFGHTGPCQTGCLCDTTKMYQQSMTTTASPTDAPRPAGRCGASIVPTEVCCLSSGHVGWHRSDDNAEWSDAPASCPGCSVPTNVVKTMTGGPGPTTLVYRDAYGTLHAHPEKAAPEADARGVPNYPGRDGDLEFENEVKRLRDRLAAAESALVRAKTLMVRAESYLPLCQVPLDEDCGCLQRALSNELRALAGKEGE